MATLQEALTKLTNRELDQLFRKHTAMVSYQNTKKENVRWVLNWVRREGSEAEAEKIIASHLGAKGQPKAGEFDVSMRNPAVRALISSTYPGYKGRKIKVVKGDRYHMSDFWDAGSREYAKAYDLATGKAARPLAAASNPFSRQAHTTIDIPDGVAIVAHSIFRGKDSGIRIIVNSNTFPKALALQGEGTGKSRLRARM
jgi:hypothetical protein